MDDSSCATLPESGGRLELAPIIGIAVEFHTDPSGMRMKSQMRDPEGCDPCIYCGSRRPPTKREHVMSRALGTFEQNWTLDCVCDECNKYFADNLELPLGRDSREAVFRIDLGLKSATGAAEPSEFLTARHFFDPLTRTISEAGIAI